MAQIPSLEELLGSSIRVFSKDGREIRGVLKVYDEYQNLLLEGAEEYAGEKLLHRHNFLFIKGGNIRMIEI